MSLLCLNYLNSPLCLKVKVEVLGRIDSQPRQEGGERHVSPICSAVLSLVRQYCQVCQQQRKHHANTGGGQSLKFYESSPPSGKESL